MKKFFVGILCVFFSVLLLACENETQLRVAHIGDNTAALSTDYSIKVTLDNDDRVKDKYVDLQLKTNNDGQILVFGDELSEKANLVFTKKDYWYNLTYLINQSHQDATEDGYKKYEEYGDKVFNFYTNQDCEVTFRIVAGKLKTNEDTHEQILLLTEDISDEINMKLKAHTEK